MTLEATHPRETLDSRMFINGQRVDIDPKSCIDVINPLSGQVSVRISDATAQQVASAVGAALVAYESEWCRTSGVTRGRLLTRLAELIEENAQELAFLESADNGKLVRETLTQARFAARNYRFFAGLADKISGRTIPLDQPDTFDYTTREPVGVAALITAWNSPMQLLSNKLAPALAAGNTVVIKPSELAPSTTLRLADLVTEAGFPSGVINVITGGAKSGVALTTDDRLGRISFTGSVPTGQAIQAAAAKTLVPVTLELGGKSANIVFDDADLDRAVVGAIAGIFAAGGQTCIAGSRLLVQEAVYDQVVEEVAARAESIVLGDPADENTQMGPIANRAQLDRIAGMVRQGQEAGGRVVAGGRTVQLKGFPSGLFYPPTVFADVVPESPIAQEEIFGPVLSIIRFTDEADAVRIANGTRYALASGVWTQDLSRAHRVARRLVAGTVWVNTYRVAAAQAPFGGVKQSGYGRERGVEALDDYLRTKNVMIDLSTEVRDPFAIRA
jgi:acyl-CoA reductase-like NAD-dependent aldehyde dehydrogenase